MPIDFVSFTNLSVPTQHHRAYRFTCFFLMEKIVGGSGVWQSPFALPKTDIDSDKNIIQSIDIRFIFSVHPVY